MLWTHTLVFMMGVFFGIMLIAIVSANREE